MISKREIFMYSEIIVCAKNILSEGIENRILISMFEGMLERANSIELLNKHKKYDSMRTLLRSLIEISANLNYILSDTSKVLQRIRAYNEWNIQNLNYKLVTDVKKYLNKSQFEEAQKIYQESLKENDIDSNMEEFSKALKDQRDSHFDKGANKRYWFNVSGNYKGNDDFIEKQLGKDAVYYYMIFSQNIHGHEAIFNVTESTMQKELRFSDCAAILLIENYMYLCLDKLREYVSIDSHCEKQIKAISKRRDFLIQEQKRMMV